MDYTEERTSTVYQLYIFVNIIVVKINAVFHCTDADYASASAGPLVTITSATRTRTRGCENFFCTEKRVFNTLPIRSTSASFYLHIFSIFEQIPVSCCHYNVIIFHQCTLCRQKVPTFELSITLSNLNHFQNCCIAGKRMKFATKFIRHYPPHLRHVATLPWDIKNSNFLQIFSRYVNKLHFQCTDFNSSACVTVYGMLSVFMCFFTILSSSLNAMLILDKHCSAVTSAVTNFRCHRLVAKANK